MEMLQSLLNSPMELAVSVAMSYLFFAIHSFCFVKVYFFLYLK